VSAEGVAQGVRVHIRRETLCNCDLLGDPTHAPSREPASTPIDEQSRRVLSLFRQQRLPYGQICGQRPFTASPNGT
jgi:hypothetical protein